MRPFSRLALLAAATVLSAPALFAQSVPIPSLVQQVTIPHSSFTLPNGWSADVNGLYESREVFGFEVNRQRGQVSAGIQKNFLGKQATFRFNVADIFYTTPLRPTSTYDNFTESFVSAQDTRVATAALTYRFGNSKVGAARKRAAGADEELRRAAGQ
jgi:hypothetical protein